MAGTDLSDALFLTQFQVNAARGDGATRLPGRLARPPYWRVSSTGSSSSRFITGVAAMPCTTTESAIVNAVVDHSHGAASRSMRPVAQAR